MQFIKPDVSTICCGIAMSMGSLLLAGGAKGKRMSLPNSRILIHQPSAGFEGQSTDIEIHAREILKTRARIDEIYAHHTGSRSRRSTATWSATGSSRRPRRDYGLIDRVISTIERRARPAAVGERVALGPLRMDLAGHDARWTNQTEVKDGTAHSG